MASELKQNPKSDPDFSVGQGTFVPVGSHGFRSPQPYVASTTRIGVFTYVKRRFEFVNVRVLPEEEEDRIPPSRKRTADGARKVTRSKTNLKSPEIIGEAWVIPDAVGPDGYLTFLNTPASSKSTFYSYYSAGPTGPLPDLQMNECLRNCHDNFNFRSKMYCQREQDRLTLPFEIRANIYRQCLTHEPDVTGAGEDCSLETILLTSLPLVCRFMFIDIITFIHSHHFQLYFRHPLMLKAYLAKLDMTRSPFLKRHINLTRLRCIILDLDRNSTAHPQRSLLTLPKQPHQLWLLQHNRGWTPTPTVDPIDLHIRLERHEPRQDGREPADWAAVVTELLENYEIGTLVIRIGKGNTAKWRELPKPVRDVVEHRPEDVPQWQIVKNVGDGSIEATRP